MLAGVKAVAILIMLAFAAAACGSGSSQQGLADSGAQDSPTEDGSGGSADDSDVGATTTEPTDGGGTDGTGAETTEADVSDTSGPSTTVEPEGVLPTDPPIGEAPGPLLLFGDDGAYRLGADGSLIQLVSGPIMEIADDGDGGVVFQRRDEFDAVWWLPVDRTDPLDLLVTTSDARTLVLEGVAGSGSTRSVVYQRRIGGGTPETSEQTLRRYRFDDRSVEQIAVTGGWESGSNFSTITGDQAVRLWSGEGFSSVGLLDLASGFLVYNTEDEGIECFDGSGLCERFRVATHHDGLIYGVGPLPSGGDGVVDQFGLSRLDPASGAVETVTAFPWDNGYWYPEDIFIIDNLAVVSRSAQPWEQDPIAPLVIDIDSGHATVFPRAYLARPVAS